MSKQQHTLASCLMPHSSWLLILCSLLCVATMQAAENDSIYKGTQLKLDLGTPILEIARSKAKVQSYEIAANVNLLHRFFPTLELGYAQADCTPEGGTFNGKGGFARVGLDLATLKKNRTSPHKLLVGVRVGTAVQDYTLSDITVHDSYWQTPAPINYHGVRCDAWGEVTAGIQVQVYKAFYMGWAVRLKVLFTRGKAGAYTAYYIPGYGYKDDMNFGFNYYVAWNF